MTQEVPQPRQPRGPFSWQSILVPLIPIVIGAGAIAAGIGVSRMEARYEAEGVEITATVTDKEYIPGDEENSASYRIAYQFDLQRGRFIGSGSVSSDRYEATQIGDEITVTYLASRPSTNRMGGPAPSFVPLLLEALGAVMALIGLGMLASTGLGLLRGGRVDQHVTEQAPRDVATTYTFKRPVSRVIVDLVGPAVGATLFLGGAWLLLTGVIQPDENDIISVLMARTLAPLVFGLFGLLMAASIPMGLRRGLRRTVLEVGPGGIWTPEMRRLSWNEVREVRLESVRGFAGGDHAEEGSGFSVSVGGTTFDSREMTAPQIPMATYSRLGFVPADPSRGAREKERLVWRLPSAIFGWLRSLRPSAEVPNLEDLAPFGVYAYDLGGSLDGAVAAVRLHREVREGGKPV